MGVWNAVLGVFGCAYGMLASLVEWKREDVRLVGLQIALAFERMGYR